MKQYFYYVPKEEGTFWIIVASLSVILGCTLIKIVRRKKRKTMTRITRDRYLTPAEAEEDRRIREQVDQELPEIIARHHARIKESRKCKEQ